MKTRYAVLAAGCLTMAVLVLGCTPGPDTRVVSAGPDEYVLSVPGMH